MALRKTVTTEIGVDVDCYCSVSAVLYRTGGVDVEVSLHAFQEEGPQRTFATIETRAYRFEFEGKPSPQVPNAVARAYELIKTLDEFAGAVDC